MTITPGDPWDVLRRTTRARIGLGRAGDAVAMPAELRFRAAHAAARDAVHDHLDVAALTARLKSLWLGDPVVIESRALDRGEYLRRPDLGREPASTAALSPHGDDLAIVLADGLSAGAVERHGVSLIEALLAQLNGARLDGARLAGARLDGAAFADTPTAGSHIAVAVPVVAVRARVAIGDHIGAALGVRAVLVLIGERPGLSATDSLGAYLTYGPRPGRTDAERNCVSNIRPPDGLDYQAAAAVIAGLLHAALRAGVTGIALKDRSNGLRHLP